MRGHTTRNVNSECGDFFLGRRISFGRFGSLDSRGGRPDVGIAEFGIRPNAGEARNTFRRNTKVGAGADQNLFQPAHKLHGTQRLSLAVRRRKTPQIENRITNNLSRTVEGYVATAITLKHLHAALRKLLARRNHVGSFRVTPKSDDWSVFKQQENIANQAIFAKLNQLLL